MIDWINVLTIVHVAISLIAIALGVPAMQHMLKRKNKTQSVVAFFVLTALTTLTGFLFPITRFTPGIAFGLLTLVLLAVAWVAYKKTSASWKWQFTYWLAALGTWYLNCFVLVVQSFLKIQPLHDLAPTQTEWPFAVAQLLLAIAFAAMIWNAYRGFGLEQLPATEKSTD